MKMNFPAGVLYGQQLIDLFKYLKNNNLAIPAVNVIGTNSINAVMETAKKANLPIIIQLSHGGAAFFAGASLPNNNSEASILGAVSAALHVHNVAKFYGVSVVLHTDHANKEKLPWIDGLLNVNQEYYSEMQRPLFSSHMIDLSVLPLKENIDICKGYLQKMKELEILLEFELGVTGGEEDGVDNSGQKKEKLYTNPQDIDYAWQQLMPISPNFSIAATFGNVHGVYKAGNVVLKPEILKDCQQFIKDKYHTDDKPIHLVFHGGSGSEPEKIKEAVSYGVIKFNIDTDTQWAFWEGIKEYEHLNHHYLQSQLGNPDGPDEPNKDYYDPRTWLREGEKNLVHRLLKAYEELKG
ncbi:class II fructose-bisphosphate aldolase [Candidatus Beckwithbacteria bacterium]|nr:class II fructose-bisphosphate aldolase [Candidatus Beckwithbacteria bacterium]